MYRVIWLQDMSIMMVKSSIPEMSPSQLHTIMACGLATIDGGLIAVFETIGVSSYLCTVA